MNDRAITVRKPRFDLQDVPTLWYAGRPGVTHFVNALGLIFPEGERFFIRSVAHYAKRIDDERLKRDVRAFMGQEAQHGNLHEAYNELLLAQGLDVRRFSRFFAKLCNFDLGPRWHALDLSITVAVEHFTAVTARLTLRDGIMAPAHPAMRKLYEWHALEELEHKSVAFDVLATLRFSYLIRMIGFVLVLTFMSLFMLVPFLLLLGKAGMLFSPRPYLDVLSWSLVKERRLYPFLRGVLPYFRPGFHPDEIDEAPLLEHARHEFAT